MIFKEKEIEFAEQAIPSRYLQKAQNNLAHFTTHTMPRFNVNWHHKIMWTYAHAWLRGDIPFLMVEAPPRHTKTEIFSRRLPAFIFGKYPDSQVISCAYGSDLASKNNRDVQRIIDSPEYQSVFPGTKLTSSGSMSRQGIRALRNSTEFEIIGHRGYYRSAGVGGAITGMGADYLIIDDPFKNRKEADSKTYRDSVWDWWSSTAFTRLEKNSRVLIVNTRWHEDDLAGRLLSQSKGGDEFSLPWVRLRLPAVYEPGDKDHPACPEDPREIGDPLWPWKYDQKRLKQIEATVQLRDWHAMYQQRPSIEEGGIIKKKYIKYFDKYPPRLSRIIQSWDLSFKEGLNNDFVVGSVWGEFAGDFYLLDMFRERCGFVDACEAIKAMSKKWPNALAKLIEEKANGAAVMDALRREKILGIIPIVPAESKEARLWSVEPIFRGGNVYFPHPMLAPWVQIAVDELVKFPNARYDDFVDTSSQGLDYLAKSSTNVLDKILKR